MIPNLTHHDYLDGRKGKAQKARTAPLRLRIELIVEMDRRHVRHLELRHAWSLRRLAAAYKRLGMLGRARECLTEATECVRIGRRR